MNYAEIKKNDIANGEGVRTSLFVSGCRNRCKNCFNAVTWDFLYGKPFDQAVEDDIIASTRPRWISGLSLLGGEPFEPENQAPLLAFLRRFRTALPGKTVWCYTGFTLEELLGKSGECRACTPHTRELLGLIDILVDGRYVEELADMGVYMQINADSITGKDGFFTKRYCNKIMKDGLLHFVGSDCHNSTKRSSRIGEAYRMVSAKFGQDYADELFIHNPAEILKQKQKHEATD